MDSRLRPFTSASLAAAMLLSLHAPAWAVGGNIRSIQFDPGTHRLRINVSSSVHATINTIDMYGRKRVIVDVENAEIGSALPHDPQLLQQLSKSWPALRNITTYQYGGANWPIVRVLLDLDAQTQDIELTQSQGTSLELQVGGNATSTQAYSNSSPPIPQSAPSSESGIKSLIKPFMKPSASSPPHPVVSLPSDENDIGVDSLKEALVRINQRYDQLSLENARLEQQIHSVNMESTQAKERLARQVNNLQAENNSFKAQLKASGGSIKPPATTTSKPASPDHTAELIAMRDKLSRQVTALQAENNALKAHPAPPVIIKESAPDNSAALNTLRKQLSQQITSLQAENNALKTVVAAAKKTPAPPDRTGELNTLRAQLSSQIASLQAQNKALESQVKTARAETIAVRAAIPSDRTTEINALREHASSQITSLQAENTALANQVKAAREEIQAQKAAAPADRTAEINTLRTQFSKQIADLQAENNQLESQLKTAKAEAHSKKVPASINALREQLSSQIASLQAENSTLENQLKAAKVDSASATAPKNASSPGFNSDLNALRKQLTVAQISLNESIRTINAQNKEMASLRSQVEQDSQARVGTDSTSKQEVERLHTQIAELKNQLNAKTPASKSTGGKQNATVLRQEADTLKQQVETLRQENTALQEKLATAEKAGSTVSPENSAEAEQYYQAGKKAKAERQTEQAIQSYRQAQALSPNNSRYTIDYSAVLAEAHRYPEGITLLTNYIGRNPTDREAYTQLGKLYLLNDQAEAATQAFTRSISVSTLNNYATALKKTNRMEDAESVFKLALTLNSKDSEVLFNLGNLYNATNKLPQAKEYYLKALALRPNFAEAHYNLGLIHAKLGERTEAISHLEKFLQLSPSAKNTETIRAYIEKLKT